GMMRTAANSSSLTLIPFWYFVGSMAALTIRPVLVVVLAMRLTHFCLITLALIRVLPAQLITAEPGHILAHPATSGDLADASSTVLESLQLISGQALEGSSVTALNDGKTYGGLPLDDFT